MSSLPWEWPGSRWWKCDLHLHSPASHDYLDPTASAEDWIGATEGAGLDVAAVTDHDSGAFIDQALAAARPSVTVIPGVEITTSEGPHLVALLPDAEDQDPIKALLGACGVKPESWGKGEARADKGFLECLEIAAGYGAVCIAAHADAEATSEGAQASLLIGINSGVPLSKILRSNSLAAVEICTDDETNHELLRGLSRGRAAPGLPLVRFSDAHSLVRIGTHTTWIKMTKPNREGLRLAFTDGESSVFHDDGTDPNASPSLAIEAITITDARYAGRSAPLDIRLNPWLNAVIGGRGTGKSTVVELTRLALDRADDLPARAREKFDDFAKTASHRDDSGALTEKTDLTVTYRKEGVRFRARWTQEAGTTLEQEGSGGWEPAEGSVRQRLPARLFSQNEVHEVAQTPSAMLAIVDASAAVDRASWADKHASALATFLTLRAKVRELEAATFREPDLRGELDDIKHKLAAFEGAEHKAVLEDLQKRRRQRRALDRWRDTVQARIDDGRAALERLDVPELGDEFDSDDENERHVLDATRSAVKAIQEATEAAVRNLKTADEALEACEKLAATSSWKAATDQAEDAYKELAERLAEAGVTDPEEFSKLISRRQALEEDLAAIDVTIANMAKVAEEATEALANVGSLRLALTGDREAFLQDVLAGNDLVQVTLKPMANQEEAQDSLRDLLGVETAFEDDFDRLISTLYGETDVAAGLKSIKSLIRMVAEGDTSALDVADARFLTRLEQLPPEALDRLDAWFPEDLLETEFKGTDGKFKPLRQGSAGQQNAAILAFLLSYGEEPMIIDQPENDLDNRLISDLIVKSLLATKRQRQLVVVTHNANIVVNGDAEYVLSLDLPKGEVTAECDGGLQEQAVRDEVCDVMEGGREAFELRYARIGHSDSD